MRPDGRSGRVLHASPRPTKGVTMSVFRIDPTLVTDVKVTPTTPRSGQTVSGYGGAIPTRYMVRYRIGNGQQWLRVKAMQYGNAGSLYVHTAGADHFLDIDTEYRLQAL